VISARRRLAATKKLGWASIATLRVPAAEVRRRNALRREASLAGIRGTRPEIHFFAKGGAWTMLAAAVAGVAILAPLLGAQTLAGGGLLPLDHTPAELWQSAIYGWRDTGLGFVGAADPFAAVLAVLGSLTFWAPSFSLVLLYFLALPLAAFGAWMAATRLTDRGSLRAVAAVLWVLAPSFLSAIAAGRPAAILVHLLLPWLFFAGFSAARSWSASASAALLFAAVIACAPSLAPALLVLWLICVVVSGRRVMRFIGIPLPALALAAPLIFDQGLRGNWLALLADPGVPLPSATASVWQLLLGFPTGQLGGWTAIVQSLGLPPVTAVIAVPVLLALVAVPALVALFLPGSRGAVFALVAALLGFGTAVAANHLFLSSFGGQTASVWAGSGLSLYWLGLVGAALMTYRSAGRFALVPAVAAAVALLVVAAPLAASIPLGTSAVAAGNERTLPAFVTAEAQTSPRVGTLQIVPQADGGILATVVRGAGVTMNDQSTLASTDRTLSGEEKKFALLAGNLVSRSGLDASAELEKFGIRFVLLRPAGTLDRAAGAGAGAGSGGADGVTGATGPKAPAATPSQDAADTMLRATTALDGNAAIAPVGDTAFGRLWRFDAPTDAVPGGSIPPNAGGMVGLVSLIVIAVVFGATVLLSIPTGANQEAVRQANREAIRRAAKANAKARRQRSAQAKASVAPATPAVEPASAVAPAAAVSPATGVAPAEPHPGAQPVETTSAPPLRRRHLRAADKAKRPTAEPAKSTDHDKPDHAPALQGQAGGSAGDHDKDEDNAQ
jgi:hypothetical protein